VTSPASDSRLRRRSRYARKQRENGPLIHLLIPLALSVPLLLCPLPWKKSGDKYAVPYKWSIRTSGLPLERYDWEFPVIELHPPIKID